MQRRNIYLDERQCEELDRLAGRRGVSRAALTRELIDRVLGGDTEPSCAATGRRIRGSGSVTTSSLRTAEVLGLELAILNVPHFPMFNGLQAPFSLTD